MAVLLGEKEGRGFGTDRVVWGSPGLHWERTVPFLGSVCKRIVFPSTKDSMGTIEQLFIARR